METLSLACGLSFSQQVDNDFIPLEFITHLSLSPSPAKTPAGIYLKIKEDFKSGLAECEPIQR